MQYSGPGETTSDEVTRALAAGGSAAAPAVSAGVPFDPDAPENSCWF